MSHAAGETLRVAHLDTGRDWRGGQAQILMLLEGLAARGVSSLLLAPPGPLLERARHHGFATHSWSPFADWDPAALARATFLLRAVRADVVHCHSARAHAVGVPAARIAHARAVLVARRVAEPVARNPISALKYRLPVDRYLCVSRAVMEIMRASGVPGESLALVPSGVRLTPVSRDASAPSLRSWLGVPEDTPLIGTLAALTAEKRHEDLLAAARLVLATEPHVHFVWLGDGPRRAELERLRDQLGLRSNVHLAGFRPEARALMAQCTVVALASELEGIATALIEAQADSVPVVATAVGGVPEVVADGVTGRLVAPKDPAAMAAALIEVLEHPERARAWVEQARLGVTQFDIERTVERTLVEYQRALGARTGAA